MDSIKLDAAQVASAGAVRFGGGVSNDTGFDIETVRADFLDAMRSAGVHIEAGSDHPIADGRWHRADAIGKKRKRNQHVRYFLHTDGIPAGFFCDVQTGVEDSWCAKKPSTMTKEEREGLRKATEAAKRLRAEERAKEVEAAQANAAAVIKATVKATPDHGYLSKKGLPVFPGLRVVPKAVKYTPYGEAEPKTVAAGSLVVPAYSSASALMGLQFIRADGGKLFMKGMAKEGSYHPIGKAPDQDGVILIAEGYATAARLHLATGYLSIAAWDAGNLMAVASAIRDKYPSRRIVLCADNDRMTVKPVENPGLTKAREAAEKIKAAVCFPVFPEGDITSTDFDDLAQASGLPAVAAVVEAALNPPREEAPPTRWERATESFDELGFVPPNRPLIQIIRGKLHEAVDASIEVLSDPTLEIYCRGDELVRVVPFDTPASTLTISKKGENIARPDGSVVITPMTEPALVETLTRNAKFEKWDGRAKDFVDTDCPADVARTILARRGYGWAMPRLKAVITAPTLGKAGVPITNRGYDPDTGLLLFTDRLWRSIPERPSYRDAQDALNTLVEPLKGFPFVDNADRAGAVALIITALLRPNLATAPMFIVTAPAAGSGKSKLADTAAVIATGRPAAVVTPTPDEAEMEKRIGAAALAGDQIINIDNVSHILKSDQLCQMLTQQEVQVRVLGSSKSVKIPSTGLICATGNNLTVYGDLNRRVVRIRLDAECERPDERAFTFDPVELARQKRPELVAAALTIARAYLVAGSPSPARRIGNFEDWSDIVRSPLIWLNYGDCLGNAAEMRETDPEKETLAEIIGALPGGIFTAKSVGAMLLYDPEMKAALSQFHDKSGFNPKRFSGFLRRYRGTPVGGRRIEMHRSDAHGAEWVIAGSA